jgi:hypothetical protein
VRRQGCILLLVFLHAVVHPLVRSPKDASISLEPAFPQVSNRHQNAPPASDKCDLCQVSRAVILVPGIVALATLALSAAVPFLPVSPSQPLESSTLSPRAPPKLVAKAFSR